MSRAIIVALDGPAGAGKSTVARRVAAAVGLSLVDTGAIYRTLALCALRNGVSVDNGPALGQIAATLPERLRFVMNDGHNGVSLDGEDVSSEIRTPAVSAAASAVARHAEVRGALLGLQRALGRLGKGSVLEGRDIGTVVFPDADVKAFVTAAPEERARRRMTELADRGEQADYATVLSEIVARDTQDQDRPIAPLKAAADAVVVDTTGKSLDEVTAAIVALVDAALARR